MDDLEKECMAQCEQSIFCQKALCQQEHQRKYVGVCIKYLNVLLNTCEEGDLKTIDGCSNRNCQLFHFDYDELNRSFQSQTINGVYPFNLCQSQCEQPGCQFLHRKWAKGVCITNFRKRCTNQQCKKEKEHPPWNQLQQKVYQHYDKCELNPEKLCEKPIETCKCKNHNEYLQNKQICIQYLKGTCPKLKCHKNHVNWEDIKVTILAKNALKPCNQASKLDSMIKFRDRMNRSEVEILCENQQLNRLRREIHDQNIIDVIFVMDLTGSMQKWKEEMENTIAKIIKEFKDTVKGFGVRVGFVGYRDQCDKEKQIVYRNLTEAADEITRFVLKQQAQGGGDTAEDIVAGLEKALSLNISRHPQSILCTFLIADSPNHGRQYHKIESDDQKDSIRQGYLEDTIRKFKEIKVKSFFNCIKINDTTDLMFDIMKSVFPDLMISQKSQPKDLVDLTKFYLHYSVQSSIQKQVQENNNKLYIEAQFEKWKTIDHAYPEKYDRNDYWKKFYNEVDNFQRKGSTGLEISEDPEIIKDNENGQFTYVFKVFDAINNVFLLAKLPKNYVDEYKQLKGKISQQKINDAELSAKTRYYVAAYACQMAYLFRKKTKEFKDYPPIFYANPYIFKLKEPFYGVTVLYAETFIDIPQFKWQKYSSNMAGCFSEFYYYTAFSHFTYVESGGNLVITDLQGCEYIFGDAAIHTKNGSIPVLESDSCNCRDKGIENFRQSQHKECSYMCKNLRLSRDLFTEKNPKIDEHKWQIKNAEIMQVICDTCHQFKDFSFELYSKTNQIVCEQCQIEEKQPFQTTCRCCQISFQHKPNTDLITLTCYGYCDICKLACLLRKRKCTYCSCYCEQKLRTIGQKQQNPYTICQDGLQYLQGLECKKCNKPFDDSKKLTQQEYNEGNYICLNH